MARSSYIYVVRHKHYGTIWGTFTVKHEMVSALKHTKFGWQHFTAYRHKDGTLTSDCVVMNIEELLKDD